jgi:SIR2-like domain
MSSSPIDQATLNELRQAYEQKNLALYLGAGVSNGSGLPTWDQLVLAMYFRAASGDWKSRWSLFPNYLYAIAEWQLQRGHEPLEITARKIRQFYANDEEFFDDLRTTLYVGYSEGTGRWESPDVEMLRGGNATLNAVAEMCCKTEPIGKGLHAVITYNYDNLLEIVTRGSSFVPIWKSSGFLTGDQRPIVHVHGYIPSVGQGSPPNEIVFTEEQYHAAAHSPYSWSNLSQIQCLSASVGLMVGLSLSDRNMRRLLDAVKITPLRKRQFVILRSPKWEKPEAQDLEKIHKKAVSYIERFRQSGAKKSEARRSEEMLGIFEVLNSFEEKNYNKVLLEMGITPIWYSDHQEVGQILHSIFT